LAYGYVHDRDVLMGKMTWEIIDLKINFPLYSIDTANIGSDRRSLYDVLTKAIVMVILVKCTLTVTNTKNHLVIFKLH
jgi:hypothetical protein